MAGLQETMIKVWNSNNMLGCENKIYLVTMYKECFPQRWKEECAIWELEKDLHCPGMVSHSCLAWAGLLCLNNCRWNNFRWVSVGHVTSRRLGVKFPVNAKQILCMSISSSTLRHLGVETENQLYLAVIHFAIYLWISRIHAECYVTALLQNWLTAILSVFEMVWAVCVDFSTFIFW